MSEEVTDLRKGDRFLVTQPIEGAFNGSPVALLNVSVSGAQLLHAQPLRIGTRATLTFSKLDVRVTVVVIVVWSHLSQTAEGLRYRSGVKLAEPSVPYAAALNSFLRTGIVTPDTESLERKRQREAERQQRRQSGPKMSVVPPTT